MPHSQPGNQNSVLWTNRSEWISHIERLEIVGGEPFYTNQWQELWKELVNLGYSNKISMDMSTNCTIYSGDILREIIPSFSRIGLGLSIDGMGAVYDYLRHPGKWEEVNQNILKYYKLTKEFDGKFTIAIANTISWVNAWTLPELFQWTQQNMPGIKMWNNIVHWPKHLSLIMLPESAKNKIESKWRNTDWGEYSATVDGIVNFMNSEQPSDEEIKNQYKNVIIHDLHRNESIVKIIPVELITDLNKYFI
jgi:sulfatase maturation enzyme AslB (radical SAM superfamily)